MKRSHIAAGLGAVVLIFAALLIWPVVSGGSQSGDRDRQRSSSPDRSAPADSTDGAATSRATDAPAEIVVTNTAPVSCPAVTVTVANSDELSAALDGAAPGAVIGLNDAVYSGNFTASTVATAAAPIFVCGSRGAVLDAGGPKEGYVLHLDGAQYWRFVGFTVQNGQKGVMADGADGSVIQGLHVTGTGDEAIHLRKFSTGNLVIDNDIDTTGLRRDKFGEGVYVGTAVSNWCTISDCAPDRSDGNAVIGNRIRRTGSESIDLKEGTTGGLVRDNTFDGTGMTGADSWVDVKGNQWRIEGNHGANSPLDGYQTHHILDQWGDWNVFTGNTAEVNADGFGYALRPLANNVLGCDNTAAGAASGLTTSACRQ